MTEERRQYLIQLTRRRIISAIKEDLDGGELLMKEVWEECSDEESGIVSAEMRAIINRINEVP